MKTTTLRATRDGFVSSLNAKGIIMNKVKKATYALPLALAFSGLVACGGGNDPDPQNVPVTPKSTSADLAGSVVKGTLTGATVEVKALNNSTMELSGDSATDDEGNLLVTLTSEPGFGIDTLVKMTVTADATASMVCDAPACGSANLGGTVTGSSIAGTELTTMGYLAVPFASASDGSADASMHVNALTTLGTNLIESAIAEGRNVSTADLLVLAQGEYSALLLRAMGWLTNGTDVFSSPVVSAESYDNFIAETLCEDVPVLDENEDPVLDEEGNPTTEEVCSDTLVDESTMRLSLLNAAFSNFAEGFSQQSALVTAYANLSAAIAGNPEALVAFRQPLFDALASHEVVAQLGLTAEQLIDLELPLFDEAISSGPVQEVTTESNITSATLSARFSISDSESAAQVFDGDVNTKWLDHNNWQGPPTEEDPSWVQVQFAEAQAVSSLFITSANDAPDRDPENFNLVASNDGENWTMIGQVIGASFDERFERQEFRFSNGLKYTYYRLNVTKNLNNDGLMQIAEIDMVGPVFTSVVHSSGGTGTASARFSISDSESAEQAFDGDVSTKWLDHNNWQGPPTVEDPSWIQMDFANPVAVNVLAITSANDAPDRDPENFNLSASNDGGVTWTKVGEWVGEGFDERFERRTFAMTNTLAYTTYRLNITKNKNNDGLMQVAEVEFIGTELPGLNHALETDAVYTARFAISDSESAAQAFDQDANTKWLDHNEWQGPPTEEDPSWIQVDLSEPKTVNTLSITSANDAPDRDPENFNLVASNDGGETWVTLATWIGEGFDERFERKDFVFSNALPYSTYRLNITKNKNNDGLMQVAEVGLIGPQYAAVDHSSSAGAVATARFSISDGESAVQAFDDDASTKWLDHNNWQGPPTEEDPSWVQVDLAEAKVVSTIAITSANDAPDRDPENFNLVGSNDGGQTWETIATWVGEGWDERFERRVFDFGNGFAYSSYRLNITKNKNNDGLMQLAEIELIGLDQ